MNLTAKPNNRRWWRTPPIPALRRLFEPYFQPARLGRAIIDTPRYILDFYRYRRTCMIRGIGVPRMADLSPVFGQRGQHEIDAHYLYLNAWAARRVVADRPLEHVDIGSQLAFTSVLSAAVPVRMVEFRPVPLNIGQLSFCRGSILQLPFPDSSLQSISSLHVIEHIGLGRYGDPLDPEGTIKAARELSRVLAPTGKLLVGIPMGRSRVFFNGHRVHNSKEILRMFGELRVVEFSGVDDQGEFVENRHLQELDNCVFACGFFLFTK